MENTKHYQSNGFWEEMERQGRSYVWLANQTGYTAYHLSRLKKGREPITKRFAVAACAAIGVRLDDFFSPIVVPMVTEKDTIGLKEVAV